MASVRRVLSTAPRSFLHPESNAPAFGAYVGPLPRVDLGVLPLHDRIARRKCWVYGAILADDVWLAFAVVRTGYAATAFAFAYDRRTRAMLADASTLAPAPAARMTSDLHADGEVAAFSWRRSRIRVVRRRRELDVLVRLRGLEIEATLEAAGAPPSLSVIAPLGGDRVDATEKCALLKTRGHARAKNRAVSLDGGLAGYDYSCGLLPRRTQWRWAFAMGRAEDGQQIALNLAAGFIGEAECALFRGDAVVPLPEPRFDCAPENPLAPWHIAGGGVDLSFEPGAVHRDATRLLLVRSHFVQVAGTFSGVVTADGREVRVRALAGVVEDQDVLW